MVKKLLFNNNNILFAVIVTSFFIYIAYATNLFSAPSSTSAQEGAYVYSYSPGVVMSVEKITPQSAEVYAIK